MNKVVLIGRMTKDAQLGYTSNTQKAVAKFTLAVDRIGEGADFINCVAFGKQAENIEKFVKKGNRLAVAGRIQTGSYDNKDGQKVYTTDVIVENAEFIEPKRDEVPQHKNEPTSEPSYEALNFDIPF